MLASGADVKIGTREFMLDTEVAEPYLYMPESLYGSQETIEGAEGKRTANPSIKFWSYDDFVSGEGLRYYNPEEPARWWYSNGNPRIPGSITSAPDRAQVSITTNVTPSEAYFVRAGGRVWLFIGRQGFYTTDLITWTENTAVSLTAAPAGYTITGACSDGDNPWVTAHNGTTRKIYKVDSTTTVTQAVTDRTGPRLYGLSQVEGQVYGWTGGRLFRYDSTATLPIVNTTIDGTGTDTNPVYKPFGETPSGTVYNSIAAGETSVFFFKASDGVSTVYEYKLDLAGATSSGRSIWNMPAGFTAKHIAVSLGVLYLAGEYGGKAALFGMSLVNRQPLFLGYFGERNNVQNLRFLSPSYGAQVLIGADDGTTSYVFVYDAEEDAFSELDERTIAADGTLLAGLTWKNRRISAAFSGTTTKVNRWSLDSDTPTGSWRWESSAWDLGYPQDEKVLLGFHIVQDPTIGAGTVQVYWQLDEDGTWTSAGTTSGGSKHTYFTVSDSSNTRKFRTLRVRMDGSSGCRVFSVTPRVYLNSLQDVWRLVLDLKNEVGRRPSNRASIASTMRDYLRTLVSDRNVVTFLDGRRYRKKSGTTAKGFTTHTVLVEFPKDAIDSAMEGRAEVILRSVAP